MPSSVATISKKAAASWRALRDYLLEQELDEHGIEPSEAGGEGGVGRGVGSV